MIITHVRHCIRPSQRVQGTLRIFLQLSAHAEIPSTITMPCMKLLYPLFLLAACGAAQKEVAMQGTDLDLARVAGDWHGEYKGAESGRTGPVNFSLQVGSHTAEGEVMMDGAKTLKNAFVKVQRKEVKGSIAPYTDPACSCEIETSFLGTVSDGEINGTFESKLGATGQVQSGTWSVQRKP